MNTAPSWKILRLLLAFGLVAVLGGCAHVPAWQRGVLADPCMQWDRQADRAALRKHVIAVREGVPPTEAGGGGACGCD